MDERTRASVELLVAVVADVCSGGGEQGEQGEQGETPSPSADR